MSLKDRLDEEPEQVEGWRPEAGEELIGKVVRVSMREMEGEEDYPVVTVAQADGTKLAFHAKPKVAREKVEEEAPLPGDEIGVRYLGRTQGKNYEYHDYRLVVEHCAQPVRELESVGATQEANQAAADARDEDIPFF